MRDRNKHKLTIEIDNLTEAQVIALNDLLATWVQLGSWGSSRDTTFFADGDGDFQPKILVNGEKPKLTNLLPRDQFWKSGHHGDYRIDYDWIGWKLAAIEEAENSCTKAQPDRTKKYHDFPRNRDAETPCDNGCGLLWKETPYYSAPVDWTITPHMPACAEGGTSCTYCGKAYNDTIHVSGPLEKAESAQLSQASDKEYPSRLMPGQFPDGTY